MNERAGQVAVIFVSMRERGDDAGYAAAAAAMDARAALQPGYRGMDSARDAAGFGITISYWADESAALAWKADADHAAIRALGRAHWYARYEVIVTQVTRDYAWARA